MIFPIIIPRSAAFINDVDSVCARLEVLQILRNELLNKRKNSSEFYLEIRRRRIALEFSGGIWHRAAASPPSKSNYRQTAQALPFI